MRAERIRPAAGPDGVAHPYRVRERAALCGWARTDPRWQRPATAECAECRLRLGLLPLGETSSAPIASDVLNLTGARQACGGVRREPTAGAKAAILPSRPTDLGNRRNRAQANASSPEVGEA